MSKTILNIKNILKIIISVLIIFSMVKSCSMASFSSENAMKTDLSNKLDILKQKGVLGANFDKTYALQIGVAPSERVNYFLAITNNLQYQDNGRNYTSSNHLAVAAMKYNMINGYGVYGANTSWESYNNGINSGSRYSFSFKIFNMETGQLVKDINSYYGNLNQNWYSWIYTTIGINTTSTKLDAGEEYGNYYITQPPFTYTPNYTEVITYNNTSNVNALKINSVVIPFDIGEIQQLNNFYNFVIKLKDQNDIIISNYNYKTNYNETSNIDYTNSSIIKITNQHLVLSSPLLYTNQLYTLTIDVYTDSTTYTSNDYYYVFLPMNAVITNGQITNAGSGDFTNQDIAINDNNNAEQTQGIIQDLYNKAFTISGDYINGKIEELKENNMFPSGDIELEKAFINLISGDNVGDFKIAWNAFTPHFSIQGSQINNTEMIPSGEVNFSKIERENETFQTTMGWTRTILGFSLGALLLKNLWKTLMLMLGVGIQVYDTNEDEKQIAKKGSGK